MKKAAEQGAEQARQFIEAEIAAGNAVVATHVPPAGVVASTCVILARPVTTRPRDASGAALPPPWCFGSLAPCNARTSITLQLRVTVAEQADRCPRKARQAAWRSRPCQAFTYRFSSVLPAPKRRVLAAHSHVPSFHEAVSRSPAVRPTARP